VADGYWWSSSFGLSSSNREFIRRFKIFLKRKAPDHKIKIRTYQPTENQKRKKTAEKKLVIPQYYLLPI